MCHCVKVTKTNQHSVYVCCLRVRECLHTMACMWKSVTTFENPCSLPPSCGHLSSVYQCLEPLPAKHPCQPCRDFTEVEMIKTMYKKQDRAQMWVSHFGRLKLHSMEPLLYSPGRITWIRLTRNMLKEYSKYCYTCNLIKHTRSMVAVPRGQNIC